MLESVMMWFVGRRRWPVRTAREIARQARLAEERRLLGVRTDQSA